MTDTDSQDTRTELDPIIEALQRDKRKRVRKLLRGMHPGKVASLLETLDGELRAALWQQIDDDREEQVLKHLSPLLGAQLRREPEESDLAEESEEGDGAATQIARVRDALEAGKFKRVGKAFRQMHPAKAAGLLEALPPAERSSVWEMLDAERAGKILVHLHDEVRARLALEMDEDELVAAARKLDLDDLVDLIQALPSGSGRQLLQAMDVRKRQQLLSMLSYPEDSAGGLMNTDHISVRADVRVGSVLRYLRLLEDLPDHTDKVMVVDRKNRYQGVLRLSRLVTSAPEAAVSEVMDADFQPFDVMLPSQDVARRFADRRIQLYDIILALVASGTALYLFLGYRGLVSRLGILLTKEWAGMTIPVEAILGAVGIVLLLEATRQLRHQCEGTPRQVPDCEIAICHGTGGALGSRHSGGTVILGRD